MKILVISLLRLGDIFIASPTIHGLRKKYPNARIDLLVNKNFLSVKSLLPDVDSVIGFDRKGLQEGLAEASCPLLEPLDYLAEFTEELKTKNYDMVVNLTQNKLSGYLMSLLNIKNQIGMSLNASGQASYSSQWFRYLNDHIAAGAEKIFHYSDIFYYGAGLAPGQNKFLFPETTEGKQEVASFFAQVGYASGPKIVVQALTSDEKKNLGRQKWIDALAQLQTLEAKAHIFLLGAPEEKNELTTISNELRKQCVRSEVAIMTLNGAISLLSVSDLLITGDTSIKHLACGTAIPIFEISIGSSDYRKTGAYKSGSLILKTSEPCAPCEHSTKCSQASHRCAESLPSELISLAASKFLQKDWAALKIIAEEYSDCADLIKADWATFGLWYAQKLADTRTQSSVSDQIDRAAWKFLLEREHLKPLAEYGSTSLKIKENIEQSWPNDNRLSLKISLEKIESSTAVAEHKLNKILASLSKHTRPSEQINNVNHVDSELVEELAMLEKDLGFGKIFSQKIANHSNMGIYQIRQLQSTLNEAFNHQQIKLKLIRSLRSQLLEGT